MPPDGGNRRSESLGPKLGRLGPPVDVEGDVHDHDVGFGEGGGIGDAAQVALAVHAVDGSVESGIGGREWEGARCKCLDARRPGSIRQVDTHDLEPWPAG